MHRNRTVVTSLFVCMTVAWFAAAGSGWAQSQAGTGAIVGTVYDASNAVVPGAEVTAVARDTGFTRSVTTNEAGQYRIILLPPGNYTVNVKHSGFKAFKAEVEVTVGSTKNVDANLSVGAATETVEVTASVVVETTASTSDALINQRSISALPINGRRFHDFVTLTPTVQIEPSRNGISFAGQRGINANVTIDGADYNQPFFGGIRGGERANTAFSIPQEAIQEFQVVAYGYSAEFGRSTGGILNAVTKSGTNDWHGSAFWYGRFSDLSTKDAFNRQALDNQHQFGGSFGGPIARDKAFFFLSFEDQQINNPRNVIFPTLAPITTTTVVPAASFPFLSEAFNFYDALQGPFTQTNDAITALGKLDYQFNANHRASVRYHFSENEALNAVATGEQIAPETTAAISNNGTEGDRTHTIQGHWTGTFSSSVVNELRAQWAKEERPRTANNLQTSVQSTIGTYGTRNFLPTTQHDKRVQIADSLNWSVGRHNLKFGGDFNWLRASQFFKFDQFGIFLPTNPGACSTSSATNPGGNIGWILRVMSVGSDPAATGACADPANRFDHTNVSYRVNIGNGLQDIEGHELAFFVHDTWRLHPRFTINAGLRWEGYWNPEPDVSNTALYNTVRAATMPLGGFDPAIIPDQTDQFAPRLGFAWDPWGNSKTVIRANGGIYYARTPLLLYAGPLNNFRNPPGDVRLTIPFNNTNGQPITGCAGVGTNPATVAPVAAGDTCNTVYWQMRRIGIDLNTVPLGGQTALTLTDLTNIASALGLTVDPNRGLAPLSLADNYESPRAWQWSLGFDHELARGWSVGAEFAYINTVHLQRNRDYNLPTPGICSDVNTGAAVTPDFQQRPTFFLVNSSTSGCPNSATAVTTVNARPILSLGQLQFRESNSRALYRAMTFKSVYRRSKWQVQSYYTLGKNTSDDDNERDAGGQSAVNAFNLQDEYGFSNLDARHLLVVNGLYELPWDFTVSGLGRFRSGRPFNAVAGFDVNEDTINNDRPFVAAGVPMARNAFRNRPVYNFDMRISKAFKLGERARIDVTADFFNLFNFDNVIFGGTTNIFGVGIDRLTGAAPTVDSRFQQLYDPANCSMTTSTGAVNTNFNPSCYNRSNIPGAPFQMQLGVRVQF